MVGLTDDACELVRASKLGTPLDKSVTAHRGRNAAFSFQTDAGRSLFLKSIDTQTEAGMKLFEATLTAHHVLSNSTDTAGLHSPAVLASDPDNGIVVQEHVADARMLAELAVASERDSDLLLGAMTSAGRAIASHIAIASLHGRAPERFGHLLEIDLTHDDILEAGASAIDDTVPFSVAFWEEYTQLTAISRDFQRRVVMFAGWHLFDRLLATGEIRSRASALDWAGAGIGRQALLNPENVAAALGLGLRSNEPAHV